MEHIQLLKDYDDILTVLDVRKILKIGRNKCYDLLQNGSIKSIKIGNSYRIPKTNLLNYLENLE